MSFKIKGIFAILEIHHAESDAAKKRIEELRKTLKSTGFCTMFTMPQRVSDEVYDSLMRELEKLEKEFPEYDSPYSPTHRIGGEPLAKFIKVTHDVPQWSFDNVFTYDELAKMGRNAIRSTS
jgi:DNA ligase (NAD+)